MFDLGSQHLIDLMNITTYHSDNTILEILHQKENIQPVSYKECQEFLTKDYSMVCLELQPYLMNLLIPCYYHNSIQTIHKICTIFVLQNFERFLSNFQIEF